MIVDGTVSASDLRDGAALAEIVDDDGDGSGLDADLLDGQQASAFAPASHDHDASYWKLTGNAQHDAGDELPGYDRQPGHGIQGERCPRFAAVSRTRPARTYWAALASNWLTPGVFGATIGGGGRPDYPNPRDGR